MSNPESQVDSNLLPVVIRLLEEILEQLKEIREHLDHGFSEDTQS